MSRGLPWSVLLHAVVLTLAVMFGNTVQRRVLEPPMTIRAHLVSPTVLEKPAEKPAEQPAQAAARPPEPVPLPPKEVPKAKPKPKPPEPKPKPKPVEPTPEPAETPADTPADQADQPALPVGASLQGTDTDFPFAWYVATVKGQIMRNWQPRQLGFGKRAQVTCAVHFVIARSGAVSQISLVDASGISVYDREALRAVQAIRLPTLPPQYGGKTLGITFIFNLEPGN